jgi:thioredoxin 1
MSHRVRLLVASWCPQCPAAKSFWRRLRDKFGFDYEEVDVDTPPGNRLASQYGIRSVPTAIVDGCVIPATEPDPDFIAQLTDGVEPGRLVRKKGRGRIRGEQA